MLYFAQELGSQANMPVGEALLRAKQRYVGHAPHGGFSRYDEKVMIQATLYGLPMYQVTVPDPSPAPTTMSSHSSDNVVRLASTQGDGTYTELTFDFKFDRHDTSDGTYYTVEGNSDTQASAGRPIQPLVITDVTRSGMPARGVTVMNAEYYTTTIDPVIATLVTDTYRSEPVFAYDGWYPTNLAVINQLSGSDNLVIVPAQYRDGIERLYTKLTLRVYYTDTQDYLPPSIWSVESRGVDNTAEVVAEVSDEESGVDEVRVMYETSAGTWASAPLNRAVNTDIWEGTVSTTQDQLNYLIQAVDKAGNVSYSSNKGLYFAAEPETIYLPLVFRNSPQ
jgi:hypothetical protein